MFNPIEHMWCQLKSGISGKNLSRTLNVSVLELVNGVVQNIGNKKIISRK